MLMLASSSSSGAHAFFTAVIVAPAASAPPTEHAVALQWSTDLVPAGGVVRMHYSLTRPGASSSAPTNAKWTFLVELAPAAAAAATPAAAAPAPNAATPNAAFGSYRWSSVPTHVVDSGHDVWFRLSVATGNDVLELTSNHAVRFAPSAHSSLSSNGGAGAGDDSSSGIPRRLYPILFMVGVMVCGGLGMWYQYERGLCRARDARLAGQRLDLTPREFDLLYFFARQPGKVFSRMDLLNAVWGYQHEGYEHTVNTHINRLRAKIEADPAQPARILTVWGRGYKFAGPEGSP